MKQWLWMAVAITLLGSCKKQLQKIDNVDNDNGQTERLADTETLPAGDDWVWVGNQATGKIEIYDPQVADWNTTDALKWSWKPTAEKEFTEYALQNWDVPNDFKVRSIPAWGGNYMVACASKGLCTIAAYPSGIKRWAYAVGTTVYPHGVELMPDGNIAVACTQQDSVKVFISSSSTKDNIVHASFRLVQAHAVLWDPVTSTLRAIGNDHIVSLKLEGTPSAPVLTEVYTQRGTMVGNGGTLYGHDLSPDLNDNNILWCSTNSGVYSFNKTTRLFTGAPGGSTGVNKSFVKAISRQKSGIFVVARKDSAKDPQPADPVNDPNWDWCTRYVDFYSATTGAFLEYRHINNARIYRAKVFRTPY